jgi:hypothetical protein
VALLYFTILKQLGQNYGGNTRTYDVMHFGCNGQTDSSILLYFTVLKIGHLKIKNYKLENFKYLGVILNEGNNNQTGLQERIENANKTY